MGTTSNFGWTYPDDGADADVWGAKLTTLFNAIDATAALIQAATVTATPPGTFSLFMGQLAPTGWIKANGTTIGNASSGGTGRANADTVDLFTVLWNNFDNTSLPIQTSTGTASTRGVSAAVDYAANKRLPVPDMRDYFPRVWKDDLGSGLSGNIGAAQLDAMQNVTGTLGYLMPGTSNGSNWYGTGPFAADGSSGTAYSGAGAAVKGATFDLSRSARTSTETRAKNKALLGIIKL